MLATVSESPNVLVRPSRPIFESSVRSPHSFRVVENPRPTSRQVFESPVRSPHSLRVPERPRPTESTSVRVSRTLATISESASVRVFRTLATVSESASFQVFHTLATVSESASVRVSRTVAPGVVQTKRDPRTVIHV